MYKFLFFMVFLFARTFCQCNNNDQWSASAGGIGTVSTGWSHYGWPGWYSAGVAYNLAMGARGETGVDVNNVVVLSTKLLYQDSTGNINYGVSVTYLIFSNVSNNLALCQLLQHFQSCFGVGVPVPQVQNCNGFDSTRVPDSSRCRDTVETVDGYSGTDCVCGGTTRAGPCSLYGIDTGSQSKTGQYDTAGNPGVAPGTGLNYNSPTGCKDTTQALDGVVMAVCNCGTSTIPGTCASNGISTKSTKPDSVKMPGLDSNATHGDSMNAKYAADLGIAANGIIGQESKTTDAVNNGNGLLGTLVGLVRDGFTAVTGLLGAILNKPSKVGRDTLSIDTTGTGIDTSGGPAADTIGDTAGVLSAFSDSGAAARSRWKFFLDSMRHNDSISGAGDTNVTFDSSLAKGLFDSLRVSWGDTSDCECDSSAFSFNVMGHDHNINMCKWDIAKYLKPIFRLLAGILLFVFYRDTVFRVVMQMVTDAKNII